MNVSVYYQTDDVLLLHGDAREALDLIDKVDLIVTDPPYGVKWESNRRAESFGSMAGDDSDDVAREVLGLSLKHLAHWRHVYVFGPISLEGLPIGGTADLVWDKEHVGSGDLTCVWGPSHERITFGVYVASKANRRDGGGQLAARLRRGSVLRYPRANSRAVRHPSEKPIPLLRELIESSSRFGETVLDPFAGSGSTLVAAVMEGRKAIGIEIEERWCEMTANRLRAIDTPMQAAA